MAPRRGGGGGGSGGFYGSGRSRNGGFSEPQLDITGLYGRNGAGNSVYTQPEIIGSMTVNIIYTIAIFISFIIIRETKKPRLKTDKRMRFTWIRALRIALVLFLVYFILQIARFGVLVESGKVGESFRFEEPITEMFGGAAEVILLGIMARLGGLVLAGLVPKFGPDPELAKLRKWVDLTVMGLWGLITVIVAAQVSLGFALAKDAHDAYKGRGGSVAWRLGDRPFAVQFNYMEADPTLLAGTYSDIDTPTAIWDSLTTRFLGAIGASDSWMSLREAQIGLEIARNCLVLVFFLIFGYVAFVKRDIANSKDGSNGMIAKFSSTIVRRFLYIIFPSLLLSTLVNLAVSVHFNLHNFSVITSSLAWDKFRTANHAFFGSAPNDSTALPTGVRPNHLYGWLSGYRLTFSNFPIFFALMKHFGWVVMVVMLAILTTKIAKATKKRYEAEEAKREAAMAGMPYALVGDTGARKKKETFWQKFWRYM